MVWLQVSVVVERMYDWSTLALGATAGGAVFQLLLKGCTIEALSILIGYKRRPSFSCCWKDVRLKLSSLSTGFRTRSCAVSVVVERMYDWSGRSPAESCRKTKFQLLLKGCTIEAAQHVFLYKYLHVSVVVERMYDWSNAAAMSFKQFGNVSVVVERMYDWSIVYCQYLVILASFSCCWKDVRLKHIPT